MISSSMYRLLSRIEMALIILGITITGLAVISILMRISAQLKEISDTLECTRSRIAGMERVIYKFRDCIRNSTDYKPVRISVDTDKTG